MYLKYSNYTSFFCPYFIHFGFFLCFFWLAKHILLLNNLVISREKNWPRIDAFELWCWRRLLRIPWTAKEIKPIHPKGNQYWIFIGNTNAEAETPILWPLDAKTWLTHLKRPWYWERLKAGGEGDDRGWDGWMTSLTQWTWVWVGSES